MSEAGLPTRMRAVVYDRYGPPEVLRIEEVPVPVPREDQVLIKVEASTVNRTDVGLRSAEYFISRFFTGLVRPRHTIPGTELAGEVVAAGPAVTRFAVGDHVFGVSSKTAGAHAEYVALSESLPLAHKPEAMSFEEAAATPDGAVLALSFLQKMDLERRQKIVVYGASGSIGVAGVQLAAAHYGADVTAVCDTRHVDLVRSLGPARVIDYTKEDFTKSEDRYDIVFDAVGKLSLRQVKTALQPGGIYASSDLGPHWQNPFLAIWTPGDKKVLFPIPKYRKEEIILLKELIDAGRYRAVIDRRYSLDDVVEAHRYVETGQKTGNVVLSVTPTPET